MKIITFDRYAIETNTTAQYPTGEDGILYLQLGLVGEIGEVLNKLKKVIRGDYKLLEPQKNEIADELGDVMWYAAQLAIQYKLKLSRIVANDIKVFERSISAKPAFLYKYAIRMNFIASQFANTAQSGVMIVDYKINALAAIIQLVAGISSIIEVPMEKILENNLKKLKKRLKANKIKGTGDGIKKRKANIDKKPEKAK